MKVESRASISFTPDASGYACVVIAIHPNQSIVYENCAWRSQTWIDIGAIQKMRTPPNSAVLRMSMTNNDVLGKNDNVPDDIISEQPF